MKKFLRYGLFIVAFGLITTRANRHPMSEWSYLDLIGYGAILVAICSSAITDVLKDIECLPSRMWLRISILLLPILFMFLSGAALFWDKFLPKQVVFSFDNAKPYIIEDKKFKRIALRVKVPKGAKDASIRLQSFTNMIDGDQLNGYIQPLLPWTEGAESYRPRSIASESFFALLVLDKKKGSLGLINKDQRFPELHDLVSIKPGTYKIKIEFDSSNQVYGEGDFTLKWNGTDYNLEKD